MAALPGTTLRNWDLPDDGAETPPRGPDDPRPDDDNWFPDGEYPAVIVLQDRPNLIIRSAAEEAGIRRAMRQNAASLRRGDTP